MKLFIPLAFLSLLSCGTQPASPPVAKSDKDLIQERVASIRTWAPVCANGQQTKVMPHTACDDGDFALFAGISCLAGESSQCKFVAQSQDQDGRFWRSPYLVNNDPTNAFSRDMALGVLAYAAKTKDVQALERWVSYVKAHDGKMCPVDTDGRCNASQAIRTLASFVGSKIGANIDWGDLPVFDQNAYGVQLYLGSRLGPLGFPLHLGAAQILIMEELNLSNTYWINQARIATGTPAITDTPQHL